MICPSWNLIDHWIPTGDISENICSGYEISFLESFNLLFSYKRLNNSINRMSLPQRFHSKVPPCHDPFASSALEQIYSTHGHCLGISAKCPRLLSLNYPVQHHQHSQLFNRCLHISQCRVTTGGDERVSSVIASTGIFIGSIHLPRPPETHHQLWAQNFIPDNSLVTRTVVSRALRSSLSHATFNFNQITSSVLSRTRAGLGRVVAWRCNTQ